MDRRRDILEAACSVIARDGIDGARVADVASSVGVSPTLVYNHFSPRDYLFKEALRFADERSCGALVASADVGGTGAEHLASAMSTAFSDSAAEDRLLWSEVSSHAPFDSDLHAIAERWARRRLLLLTDLVRRGMADGSIMATDAEDTARILTALLLSLGTASALGVVTPDDAVQIILSAVPRAHA